MMHNKCLAYDSNVKTGCALIRNPAFFNRSYLREPGRRNRTVCGNTHMTVNLFPLFSTPPFLTALLSLASDLRTKSICNYFSVFPHSSSLTLSLYNARFCSALENRAPPSITAKCSLNRASKTAHLRASQAKPKC